LLSGQSLLAADICNTCDVKLSCVKLFKIMHCYIRNIMMALAALSRFLAVGYPLIVAIVQK